MKVLVTGATGFVGEEILRQLRDTGHTARILAREPNSARTREIASRYSAEIHSGDILQPASLPPALAGCDAVIHIVGVISEIGDNTFENVHTRGTQNVVTAAQQSGVKRFIHMSALGVRPNAIARYHRSKWAAEEILRASGLDYTIFRPSIIYGPHDHFVNMFATMSRYSPFLPVMGSGRSKMQPVPVGDVAKCFVGALTEPTSIGQTYDLCGRDILTFEEIFDTILRVIGRKRFKLHLPMPLARFQAALMEFIFPKIFRRPSPLNRDQLLMLQEDNTGNPAPANELFGITPISFADGIARYLRHTV
jgi:uncharacterized protein YbjT (DUF2867 family)